METKVKGLTEQEIAELLSDESCAKREREAIIVVKTIQQIADEIVNRFAGMTAIDEPTKKAYGALLGFIEYRKPYDMVKNSRTKKDENGKNVPNPFLADGNCVWQSGRIKLNLNTIWQNAVDNARKRHGGIDTGWIADTERANGIKSYRDSRVIGILRETLYFDYNPLAYVGETTYTDNNGKPLRYKDIEEYAKVSKESKEKSQQKEADKHGLSVENDVQKRQMKFENILSISLFGYRYIVAENIKATQ